MTIREFYKIYSQKYKDNKYLNDICLRTLIVKNEGIKDMSTFFLCFDDELKNESKIIEDIKRVINGEPYQYVINEAEFYGLKLYVDKNVLIPRLETEELVHTLIHKYLNINYNYVVADIGTGSGCIALAMKKHLKNANVFAVDISNNALNVAKFNSDKMQLNISLLPGDLLSPLIDNNIKVDVLISNPPYIKNKNEVDENVLNYEPHLALFAKNGIDFYERILKESFKMLKQKAMIAFEFNYDQKNELNEIIKKYYPTSKVDFYKDAGNKWRYVIICLE